MEGRKMEEQRKKERKEEEKKTCPAFILILVYIRTSAFCPIVDYV
jgi:hypothetical protein